jgi:ribosomal protein L29
MNPNELIESFLMKISAIRSLSREEVLKELSALYKKEAASNLLKHARDEKANTASQSLRRKAIARLLTVLRERELIGALSS